MHRPALALISAIIVGLAACAPVYETRYELTPPVDRLAAGACLARCEAERDVCTGRENAAYQACDLAAQQRVELCRRNASIQVEICQRSGKLDCGRRLCSRPRCTSAGLEACGADYRSCFAACGGAVTESKVCVAGCP
jgi:hypothetical protein